MTVIPKPHPDLAYHWYVLVVCCESPNGTTMVQLGPFDHEATAKAAAIAIEGLTESYRRFLCTVYPGGSR